MFFATESSRLVERLNRQGFGGYLHVAQATPWANVDEALAETDVDEMSPEAIRAFLDIQKGGEKGVGMYVESILKQYFGEYSPTAKSYRTTGGRSTTFKEYASFYMQWMLL
jgi:hypothetical protein